jgi:hypothetical protein
VVKQCCIVQTGSELGKTIGKIGDWRLNQLQQELNQRCVGSRNARIDTIMVQRRKFDGYMVPHGFITYGDPRIPCAGWGTKTWVK